MKLQNYPSTQKVDTIHNYFGTEVPDPYFWLEDDRSKETEDWVNAQNKVTNHYLSQIPYHQETTKELTKLWNYEKISTPFQKNGITYFYKNNGLDNHSILFAKDGNNEVEILNPNTFSDDGSTSLAGTYFSPNGKYLGYLISENGSDWRKAIVKDLKTGEIISDTLSNLKFSPITWKGDEGFYYSSYDKPNGSALSTKTDQHKVYYHRLGTPQSQDKVIFGKDEKYRYIYPQISKNNKYLFISAANTTSGNKVFIKDLSTGKTTTLVDYLDADYHLVDSKDDELYIYTNDEAPNGKLIRINAKKPQIKNAKTIIPTNEMSLSMSKGGGYLFAHYLKDAITEIIQFDYQGNKVRKIELPENSSVYGFSGDEDNDILYYSYQNYISPKAVNSFSPQTGISNIFWEPKLQFSPSDFTSKQVFYYSKDGTKIPMIISHKKGIKIDGKSPTILYGYGGFNVSLTPSFNPAMLHWMNKGGIYAVPNIRGGGEYGKEWHIAGTQLQKQNVFDDFIAAAEYLIKEKYTSSEHLAIRGRSNGGLLVGAVMTQRPDLIKVALPGVGVLDMLRYHTFTAGAGWSYDYGTADQSVEMFNYLKGYSPLHNINSDTKYPATMVLTADHDDRVVPAHSFKFGATLQEKQAGEAPILIRIETDGGHGAGLSTEKAIQAASDELSFAWYHLFDELN